MASTSLCVLVGEAKLDGKFENKLDVAELLHDTLKADVNTSDVTCKSAKYLR